MGSTSHSANGTPTGTLVTSPQIQGAVIALRTTGKSKRKIAAELGIHRVTVDKILAFHRTDEQAVPVAAPDYAKIVQNSLVPKALNRIEQVLPNDTDTARYVLDNTVFKQVSGPNYTVNADQVLMAGIDLMPRSSQPSQPSTDDRLLDVTPVSATATEAATKPPSGDIGLPNHTNFSENFSAQPVPRPPDARSPALIAVPADPGAADLGAAST